MSNTSVRVPRLKVIHALEDKLKAKCAERDRLAERVKKSEDTIKSAMAAIADALQAGKLRIKHDWGRLTIVDGTKTVESYLGVLDNEKKHRDDLAVAKHEVDQLERTLRLLRLSDQTHLSSAAAQDVSRWL